MRLRGRGLSRPCCDRVDYGVLPRIRQQRVQRETHDLARERLGHRKPARTAEVPIGGMLMDGTRVVHCGSDTLLFERASECVSVPDPDDVEVPDRAVVPLRQLQRQLAETAVVARRQLAPPFVPTWQVRPLGEQYG